MVNKLKYKIRWHNKVCNELHGKDWEKKSAYVVPQAVLRTLKEALELSLLIKQRDMRIFIVMVILVVLKHFDLPDTPESIGESVVLMVQSLILIVGLGIAILQDLREMLS